MAIPTLRNLKPNSCGKIPEGIKGRQKCLPFVFDAVKKYYNIFKMQAA
jgi:hypothetical protein